MMNDITNRLINKRIILGITGGIAAYKSADLARRLREAGAEVHVVMTAAAKEFITPLTMQAVSGNPVHDDLLDSTAEAAMGHIQLARWADAVLIAPASADFIARYCHGHANDLLTTLCLATRAPIVLAPAMNQVMWEDKATQQNMQQLQQRGVHSFGPATGDQACGEIGPGRMLEPTEIVAALATVFKSELLTGKKIVITAGPTQEPMDPIRYLTNHSSGKMGFALATACVEAGAQVTLIAGPVELTTPARVTRINVTTALEMYDAAMKAAKECDIFIGAAAVADYRCAEIAEHKIAKSKEITLKLVSNPDILADVAHLPQAPFCVGLAAQTNDVVAIAREKIRKKGIQMIAANQVGLPDRGFHVDNNAFTVIWDGGEIELDLRSKQQLARDFINIVAERYTVYANKIASKNS